jgi:hypothetical protein
VSDYEELVGSLEMYRGDTESFLFEVLDEETEEPVVLTGAALRFTVRDDVDGTQIFQRKNAAAGGSSSEIETTDAANGKFTVKVVPTNTISCTADTRYKFDIEMTIGAVVKTLMVEDLYIKGDITR